MLTLGLEEILIDIKGQAVHSRANDDGKYEIGIEFQETDDKTSQELKKFVDALKDPKNESD
jgi:hypothetical protein